MKTIGRILIILVVFSIVAGLMVTAVNASGANNQSFGGTRQFRPEGGGNGFRPERDHERSGGTGWIFGLVKNVGIMAVLVTLIVWPKSVAKKKRKQAAISSADSQL